MMRSCPPGMKGSGRPNPLKGLRINPLRRTANIRPANFPPATQTPGIGSITGISGNGQRTEDGLPDGMEPPEGYSDAAGNAKSNQSSQSSRDLEKTQRPASQDKPASSPAKTYLIHVRALTDRGEARVKEEDILRTYRQEVESILQKEDIPVNYRAYIKNYFISIGINTEENAHESK